VLAACCSTKAGKRSHKLNMRILLTNHFPFHGSGTGTYVRDLATMLSSLGHEVRALIVDCAAGGRSSTMLAHREDPCMTTRIVCRVDDRDADLDFDFPCFTAHPYSQNTFGCLSNAQMSAYVAVTSNKLRWVVESFGPDIVHCQHIWLQASALEGLPVPFVISAQGTDLMGYAAYPQFRGSARRAAVRAGRILAASEYIRERVVETFTGLEDKVETVLSAIDTALYESAHGSREVILKQLGLPVSAGPLVAFVGKLVRFKGPDLMIEAARIYGRADHDICTVLCGDGPLRPSLENSVQEMKRGKIWFLGDRQICDRAALLHLADVLVIPSRMEPFGLVALEAMASGTPVLATRAGGLCEIVNDRIGGLIEPDSPHSLARGVLRAISEGWKASKGRAAKEYVRNRHNGNAWVAKLEKVYRNVIEART